MGVLDIFGNLLKRDHFAQINYLSLTLTPDKVIAIIWTLDGENINFIGSSHKDFHNIDSLIHEAAAAIDHAAQNIKTDVNQVVFGLSNYWFEDGKITKETTNILKNLAQELELDAQAFVPIAASINHFLKLRGEQSQAVLVGAYKDYCEVSIVSGGNLQSREFKGSAKTEDINRLLKELKQDLNTPLPQKIVIFGDASANLKKSLEKEKNLDLFAAVPKLEELSEEEVARCIAYSQAADVLGSEPQILQAPIQPQTHPVRETAEKETQQENIQQETLPQDSEKEVRSEEEPFDFREGEDVLATTEEIGEEESVPSHVDDNLRTSPKDEYAVEVSQPTHGYESPAQKLTEHTPKKKSLLDSLITLSWANSLIPVLSKGNKKTLLAGLIVLTLAIMVVIFIAGYTFTNAQILIKANSKPFESDFDATVASGAALDTTRLRIPGEEQTATIAESRQAPATGTKKTGNNATGEVKVFNWTTTKVSFNKGVVIIAKNGIKFELDSAIEVASRSASTPGETSVMVKAQEFGTNGNLASGTEFTFQQYDELLYSAKNDNALTGGDEKEITVVTQQDLTNLEKNLQEFLTKKAKEQLQNSTSGQHIGNEAIEVKVTKKLFDKKAQEEGDVVNLDMEVQATALVYNDNTLKELLAKIAQEQTGGGQEALPENVDIRDLKVNRGKGTLKLEGKYTANLTPKINIDEIKEKIAGRGTKKAREIMKENPEIAEVEISFSPNLIIFSTIPKNKEKIDIKVEAIK